MNNSSSHHNLPTSQANGICRKALNRFASFSKKQNEGSWAMNVGTAANNFSTALRGDSPAAFHVTSANFSFADAHAKSYKWLDGTTIAFANDTTPAKDAGGTSKTAAQHAGHVYAIWVANHYPGGQNRQVHINFRKPGANRMNLA